MTVKRFTISAKIILSRHMLIRATTTTTLIILAGLTF